MATSEPQSALVRPDATVLLPKAVSDALNIRAGDEVEFTICGGDVTMRKKSLNAIEAVRGMFGPGSSLGDDLIELRREEN